MRRVIALRVLNGVCSNCSECSSLRGGASLLVAGGFAGVEQFCGEDVVVALDLSVVFRSVRFDAVVSGRAE